MTRLLRFGDTLFEDNGVEFGTNFGDRVTRADRLPGMDGSFDVYGTGRAPAEVGNVRFNLILKAATAAEMQARRDALLRLAATGKRALFVEPTDASQPRRFCMARIANVQVSERYSNLPAETQAATINWQVSDPRWYSKENMWYLDGSHTLDGSLTLQGAAPVALADGDVLTVTNAGSAPTQPRVQVEAVPSGAEMTSWTTGQGLGLRRLSDDDRVLSEWFWLGTVTGGEQLIVDHAAARVRYEALTGSVSGYPNFTASVGFAFPALEPGANRFQVFGAFSGKIRLTIDFLDAWS